MAYRTKREIFEHSNTWVLDLTRQILSQIERYTLPVRVNLESELGSFNDSDANLAEIAVGMEPEPFGLAHIYQCIPYANPKIFRQDFKGAVQRGWLTVSGDGTYRATEKGRHFYYRLSREIRTVFRNIRPLPIMQLERLDTLLEDIIFAMATSTVISYRPAFDMDRRLVPTAPSTLQKICCKLSHVMAYRDDAYINAWMDQEVNSFVWEAFSYIYKGQAQTATELTRQLEGQRQYDEATYAEALADLVARDWIVECNNNYEPTVEGLKVLAEVARTMTQYFFEPWADMEAAKINQLKILMEAMVRGLKSPQTKRWHGQSTASRSFGWRSAQWVRDKVR
jgi:hypothetical protein